MQSDETKRRLRFRRDRYDPDACGRCRFDKSQHVGGLCPGLNDEVKKNV